MNEVGPTVGAAVYVANSASSTGARSISTPNGNALPDHLTEKAVDTQSSTDAPKEQAYPNGIRSAVVEVNNFVQSIQRDLQFDLDSDLEQTIVKVIDSNSGDVIRQIPEDIFLELARRLNQDQEIRLLDDLG